MAHEIARTIADGRSPPPPKVGQHQFTCLAFLDRLASTQIKDFCDELTFVDMQPLLLRAGEAVGPHLGHACMVIGACAPRTFDALPGSQDRGSRLTGMDGHMYTRLAHIHTILLCHLCQTQGIAGCTDQHRGSDLLDSSQSLERVHATTRDGESTQTLRPFVGRPETNEGT